MKKVLVAAAVIAVCGATPAFAQSGPVIGPATGPRVEATVGWDRIELGDGTDSVGKSGVTYGGEIGYDLQFGNNLLLGAYAGIDGSSTKECLTDGTERGCVEAGRNITVGGRIGTRLGQRATLYAKGGYSNGRVQVDYTDTAFPRDDESLHQDLDGFHVGAGAEIGLSRGFYGKAEYVYTRYSTNDDDFDTRLERHRVLAGFGYRF